jgi:hypothetical protein
VPHFTHVAVPLIFAPQSEQKRAVAGIACPQLGHGTVAAAGVGAAGVAAGAAWPPPNACAIC